MENYKNSFIDIIKVSDAYSQLATPSVYINRPQVSMVYKLINHHVGRTLEEFVNNEPQASGLQILRVFYQHPKWFISL